MQGMMILLALSPFVSGEWRLLTDPTVPSINISVGSVQFERGILPQDNATTVSIGSGNFRTTGTPSNSFTVHRVWGSPTENPPFWTADYQPIQNTVQTVTMPSSSVDHEANWDVKVRWSYTHWWGVEDWGLFENDDLYPSSVVTRNMEKRTYIQGTIVAYPPRQIR